MIFRTYTTIHRDEIGDAYEYLIGKFASDSGKKGGEFYTPPALINRRGARGEGLRNFLVTSVKHLYSAPN